MIKINHERILQAVIEKYEKDNGEAGFAKIDIENMVFEQGGNKNDVYRVMTIGMRWFFGDCLEGDGCHNN